MIISWYGDGCFKIQNGNKVVLTDVALKEPGISAPRAKADILLKTITPWPIKDEKFNGFISYGAGEYDIDGIKIKGFQISKESDKSFFKTVYVVNWEGISLGLFGVISGSLDPKIMENFEDIDVIIAPGSGEPFIPQRELIRIIKQLNPKIFIPSFIKDRGKKDVDKNIDILIREFNGDSESELKKFTFNKKDLKEIKKTKVICLKT